MSSSRRMVEEATIFSQKPAQIAFSGAETTQQALIQDPNFLSASNFEPLSTTKVVKNTKAVMRLGCVATCCLTQKTCKIKAILGVFNSRNRNPRRIFEENKGVQDQEPAA